MLAATAFASYLASALAFSLLSGLLLVKWRAKREGIALVVACFMTVAWAAMAAYCITQGAPSAWPVRLLESARNAAWAAFLLGLLAPAGRMWPLFQFRVSSQAMLHLALYVALAAATLASAFLDGALRGIAAFVGGSFGFICSTLLCLLLIEQLLRNASTKERWALKFAFLGIGGIFAFDFYFYVDALLFGRGDAAIWASRGLVSAIAVPLIAVSAARNPAWSIGIAVSRRAMYHSFTLIGSAAYLLAVAGAGYYLRFFGGEWVTILQSTFFFCAAIVLVLVLISGSFRSRLRVLISKHFYSYGYDYREEWLRFTRILSADGRQLGERVIEGIAALVESPKGLLFVRNASGAYEPAGKWNTDSVIDILRGEDGADARSLYRFLAARRWVIDITQYRAAPEEYEGLRLPSWLGQFPHAWLIVPLMQSDELFGFVVLAQSKSPINLNWEVRDLLKIAASQAACSLAGQQTADALATARQFETFNRMSTFVVHDLKNLVSQLALLTANAEKHKSSPEFQQDMVETMEHAVQKMRVLLGRFNRESSTEASGRISLNEILGQAVASKKTANPKPVLVLNTPGLVVLANASRLERVIGHLIQNAIEATPRTGSVTVKLSRAGSDAVIEIIDTGRGMSDDFMAARLFKPFESTKPAGMGIGVFETKEYLQHIGGRLDVRSKASHGTTFRITLPLYDYDRQQLLQSA